MKQKLLTLCLGLALVGGAASLAQADEGQMSPMQHNEVLRDLPHVPGLPHVPNLLPYSCWAENANGVPFTAIGYDRRVAQNQALASCHLGSFGVACRARGCR